MAADQAKTQACKEKFRSAFDEAVSKEESTQRRYKEELESGMARDKDFRSWSGKNAYAYIQVHYEYIDARSVYERALASGDQEGCNVWKEMLHKTARDAARPRGPNYDVLIRPD
ncbi:unnamed protein product [Fusarium equiseti]|uniref:Uncharacterized protein n=1 Tax=Fusarium equiseti TaxID=61235 RepID=A0A8J2N7L9_FUSEQ|nr:unnamed protein product [Fusarium equiseti]